MSLVTKLFIILVLIAAMVALGVQITLFSHRSDFKQKYLSLSNIHWQTLTSKEEEIAALKVDLQNAKEFVAKAERNISNLENDRNALQTRVADLEIRYSDILAKHEKLITDFETVVKQLDVQMMLLRDKDTKLGEFRDKLTKANSQKMTAEQELLYVRNEVDKITKELSELEQALVNVTKEKQKLQEILSSIPADVRVPSEAPSKTVEGKVMTYSAEINAVIINVGEEHGVRLNDKFSVYRQDQFVATARVVQVDKKSSVLILEIKSLEPKAYDDVSNNLLPGFRSPSIAK